MCFFLGDVLLSTFRGHEMEPILGESNNADLW